MFLGDEIVQIHFLILLMLRYKKNYHEMAQFRYHFMLYHTILFIEHAILFTLFTKMPIEQRITLFLEIGKLVTWSKYREALNIISETYMHQNLKKKTEKHIYNIL